jgi:phage terminase small subunit
MTARKKAPRAKKSPPRATKAALRATQRASEILEKLDAKGFTPKEARFVQEYPIDLNGAAAARRAGYSEDTARQIACELIAKPHIQEAIAAEMSARAQRTRVTQDRVLTVIADTAYFDIADAFNSDGSLKAIHDMPEAIRRSIAGIEVEEIRLGKDGPVVGHLKKVKLADSTRSRELLGRHLKLFTDKVEHSGGLTLEEILTASRK